MEFITKGLNTDLLIIFSATLILSSLSGGIFFAFYSKYKKEKKLFSVCTKPSIGIVKSVGRSSLNTGHSNPTFIDIEFKGSERSFTNVDSELRFKYKEGDKIEVLYNPKNKSEFIFT